MKRIQIDALNLMAEDPQELIRYAEADYHNRIQQIADEIAASRTPNRTLLLSGPSASGKTWTARLLCSKLEQLGIPSLLVSLDNFYKDRTGDEKIGRENKEFETVEALDTHLLLQCVQQLRKKRRTFLPHFKFSCGKRDRLDKAHLPEDGCLIIEGMHALNPDLLPEEMSEAAYKVYVNVDTNYDSAYGQILGYQELRLMRRMLRDYNHRGVSIAATLVQWKPVVESERKLITPYVYRAQARLDSAHAYEPLLYRNLLLPLLPKEGGPTVDKLREALQECTAIPLELLPKDSMLCEFAH